MFFTIHLLEELHPSSGHTCSGSSWPRILAMISAAAKQDISSLLLEGCIECLWCKLGSLVTRWGVAKGTELISVSLLGLALPVGGVASPSTMVSEVVSFRGTAPSWAMWWESTSGTFVGVLVAGFRTPFVHLSELSPDEGLTQEAPYFCIVIHAFSDRDSF